MDESQATIQEIPLQMLPEVCLTDSIRHFHLLLTILLIKCHILLSKHLPKYILCFTLETKYTVFYLLLVTLVIVFFPFK